MTIIKPRRPWRQPSSASSRIGLDLKRLKLNSTRVTDAGLAHLAALEKLQFLDLSNTAVTDAGLRHLSGLKELQLVFLNRTKVSRAGGIALQKVIPSVQLVVD